MTSSHRDTIRRLLEYLYGPAAGGACFDHLTLRLDAFRQGTTRRFRRKDTLFSKRDIIVITYGDMLRRPGEAPLRTLLDFHSTYLSDVVNTLHILPFYPYSSDDGFSVIDYRAVDPALGTWADIERFAQHDFRLMFDAVINHISVQSEWFQRFLAGDEAYRDYFITVDPATDLSMVTRPRALPLLTPFETARGIRYVWTTFSADQVDLNYANPRVLCDILDVLLFYVERGADVIRLDAIAYLWKEPGTSCIHLPQTHAVVRLMRAVLDDVAPGVLLITETNVPHEENISYFGDGTDEAHLVYNFSLPPLVAHAILTGSARHLTEWAATLEAPSLQTTFFNFTASHDGIGIRPVTGILSDDDVGILLDATRANGGAISSKTNPDGSTSPYELNITYFDLLNGEGADIPIATQVDRFLVSQAIMLALAGVPGIYLHSLLGTRNYDEGVRQTGHPRTINRHKLDVAEVIDSLGDETTLRHAVFEGYRDLLTVRTAEAAFHPNAAQRVLDLHDAVFTLLRRSTETGETIIAMHNVSGKPATIGIDLASQGVPVGKMPVNLTSPADYHVDGSTLHVALAPYQTTWLKV
jgi:glycosidase